jgi:CubicO group peptidase (beta-lactamase class C family)
MIDTKTLTRRFVLPVALLAATCVSSRAGAPQQAAVAARPSVSAVFPGESWDRVGSPESVGFSRARLGAAVAHARELATTSFVAVVDGRILVDYGDVTHLSYIASVRKSVLSMLFGNYVDKGTIRLDKTLKELNITDVGGLSDHELEATITDLLGARSGVYHEASYSGDDLASAPPRNSQEHGTYYLYSNWDFNALGTIFEQETGRNLYDALESDLARPLGMQDFDRSLQKKEGDTTKSIHQAYPMWFSTRDMARIGYLMMQEGNWAGKQLVPREWARRIVQVNTPITEMNPPRYRTERLGYGYLWWVFDGPQATGPFEGAYTGVGAGGQFITVLPKLHLVVAHKTDFSGGKPTVSRDEYLGLLDDIVAAYCGDSCSQDD